MPPPYITPMDYFVDPRTPPKAWLEALESARKEAEAGTTFDIERVLAELNG
jgi:hypothetical protein